jgi:hypothetical protein
MEIYVIGSKNGDHSLIIYWAKLELVEWRWSNSMWVMNYFVASVINLSEFFLTMESSLWKDLAINKVLYYDLDFSFQIGTWGIVYWNLDC